MKSKLSVLTIFSFSSSAGLKITRKINDSYNKPNRIKLQLSVKMNTLDSYSVGGRNSLKIFVFENVPSLLASNLKDKFKNSMLLNAF